LEQCLNSLSAEGDGDALSARSRGDDDGVSEKPFPGGGEADAKPYGIPTQYKRWIPPIFQFCSKWWGYSRLRKEGGQCPLVPQAEPELSGCPKACSPEIVRRQLSSNQAPAGFPAKLYAEGILLPASLRGVIVLQP